MEKGQIRHADKHRRANTAGDRVEEKEDSEDALIQEELSRLTASKGNDAPIQTLESDLVSITRAGRSFVSRVQSDMGLRSKQVLRNKMKMKSRDLEA
jgi:hypothetical protein